MAIRRIIRNPAAAAAPDFPLTAADLADAIGADTATAARLLEVATALVDRFTTGAPASIRREAVIRCAGWLHEAPASGARMESEGEIRTAFSPAMTGALRSSGAMGLLSPWKIRRAGAIG